MYKTRIASDFFNIKGLETRTGVSAHNWGLMILKELIDNGLDAIESKNPKNINAVFANNNLRIFDNGNGISVNNVKQIYDFDNYISKNRHVITASRGKQGNGLKTIIGVCYIKGYKLLWHTADGIILQATFNAEMIADQELEVSFENVGKTNKTGIEIDGIDYSNRFLETIISQYSTCNTDVNFNLDYMTTSKLFKATTEPIDHTEQTSLEFYSYHDFKRLINVQPQTDTYKAFLNKYFGTRIANSSSIKKKIADLDLEHEVKNDFDAIKTTLKNKSYTLLGKHKLEFDNSFEVSIKSDSIETKENTNYPCIIEYSVTKLDEDEPVPQNTSVICYINNSITYYDGASVRFDYNHYKISNTKTVCASDLDDLLNAYKDFTFNIHIVSPYLKFKDFGKTTIDATDFIEILVNELRKSIAKEKKNAQEDKIKKEKQNALAKKYMTQAFLEASTNGKYAITARQMYYKLRELINKEQMNWETKNTYSRFTQTWLTQWIEDNEQYESNVNFSERGNFYVDNKQVGLGSANVRIFLDNIDSKSDTFTLYGGINDKLHIDDDFNMKFRYDKALYVEKTGLDAIFRAEHIDEKYHVLIVSGQGFASREARKLLYNLQQQGLKLYCLHDLDTHGANIYSSMIKANDKFKFDLDMVDLGINPNWIDKYNIIPEEVKATKDDSLSGLNRNYYDFFYNYYSNGGKTLPRAELSAFTTEQILEILDDTFKGECNLPTVNISQSLQIDNKVLREVAFMQIIKEKYSNNLQNINIPFDLSEYDGKYTMDEAKKVIPQIQSKLIEKYKQQILKQIAM